MGSSSIYTSAENIAVESEWLQLTGMIHCFNRDCTYVVMHSRNVWEKVILHNRSQFLLLPEAKLDTHTDESILY